MVVKKAKGLFLMQEGGRYKIEIDQLSAGNWVLITGIDQSISKTATIFSADVPNEQL